MFVNCKLYMKHDMIASLVFKNTSPKNYFIKVISVICKILVISAKLFSLTKFFSKMIVRSKKFAYGKFLVIIMNMF